MFFYELKPPTPPLKWPESEHGVPAIRLCDGSRVTIPAMPAVNILVTGTPGYGKTVFAKGYVDSRLEQNPNLYIVFYQVKPNDFTGKYLRPQDKVVCFSSGLCPPENLFKWNMIKEVRDQPKPEWNPLLKEISTILFKDHLEDKRNITWVQGAQNLFEGFVKVILYCYKNNPSNAQVLAAMKEKSRLELLHFLAEYPGNLSMLRDNFDFDPKNCKNYTMPRKGSDLFFFLQGVLDRFGGTFMSEDGQDTIHDYLSGRYGERLFILHDYRKKDSSTLFEVLFFKFIGSDKLSMTSTHKGEMLWVLDEADKMEADFGLLPVVTLGREYQLSALVSTQSTESLFAIAPDKHAEHLTNAAMSGFSVQAAFHPGDEHTIETMQTLFGKKVKERIVMPLSRYDKPNVLTELVPIVEDQDFASLGIGECYIKIRDAEPERVKIIKE